MLEKVKKLKKKLKENPLPIYICGHVTPDHDSIGSCLSLGRMLEKLGHTVYVLLEEKDKDILKVHSNQHLISHEVVDDKYIFIALDLNESYRLGRYKKYFESADFTINIDHHQGNKTKADIVISQPEKSSTSEIVYKIISHFGRELFDTSICESLYTGIMTDTSGFVRRLSTETLSIAQKLINKGINYEYLIRETFSHRTLYELKALGRLIEEIKYDECLHYVVIDKSIEYYKDLTHNQITKTIAEELRKIEDMDIFLIFIKDGNILTTKCMSNISKNANLIAAQFNGGGHKGEAGFTVLNTSVDEVIAKIKEYLKNN